MKPNVPDHFLFFDATAFDDKPTGSALPRMHRMKIMYSSGLFPRPVPLGTAPPPEHLRRLALDLAAEVRQAPAPFPVCLDWEPRELRPRQAIDDYLKAASVYTTIVDTIRAVCPGLRLGPYAILPEREYWHRDKVWRADARRRLWGPPIGSSDRPDDTAPGAINDGGGEPDAAPGGSTASSPLLEPGDGSGHGDGDGGAGASRAGANPPDAGSLRQESLHPRGLADVFDFVCPSIYAFYDDVPGWIAYAEDNLRLAREYQKPVYAFIMPTYHPSNRDLGRRPLGERYWRTIVETTLRLADGLVVWTDPEAEGGTPGRRPRWSSPWWWAPLQDYLSG